MKRIIAFDYLRAIAILCIVLCHFCYNFSSTAWLGKWLGNTFNILFLIMSAFLLGISWDTNNNPKFGWKFLTHRMSRLSKVYYPFLIIMFIFCFTVGGYSIGLRDILLHFTYLPWLDKLEGFGHLWFMTMICFCYISLTIVSRLRKPSGGGYVNWLIYILLISLAIAVMPLINRIGLPYYAPLYLIIFDICFIEATSIINFLRQKTTLMGYLVLLITLITIITAKYISSDIILKLVGCIGAFSIITAAVIFLQKAKGNRTISFVSQISMEIYLVHHVFAYGRFSVMHLTDNWFIGLVILFIISILLGFLLHKLSEFKVKKYFKC